MEFALFVFVLNITIQILGYAQLIPYQPALSSANTNDVYSQDVQSYKPDVSTFTFIGDLVKAFYVLFFDILPKSIIFVGEIYKGFGVPDDIVSWLTGFVYLSYIAGFVEFISGRKLVES